MTVRTKKIRVAIPMQGPLKRALRNGARRLRISQSKFIRLAVNEKINAAARAAAAAVEKNKTVSVRLSRGLRNWIRAKARLSRHIAFGTRTNSNSPAGLDRYTSQGNSRAAAMA
jgi:hypothetical protein